MRRRRDGWNFNQEMQLEFDVKDGVITDLGPNIGKPLPTLPSLGLVVPEKSTYALLTLDINYEGCNDPGKTSGAPETCYPPSSDDNRYIASAKIEFWAGEENVKLAEATISEDGLKILRDLLEERVDNHDPDWPDLDDDGPDRDDYDD